MTVKELNDSIEKILSGIPDKDFDRACIMEDCAGVSRETAAAHPGKELTESVCQKAISAANTRALGYPLQYILGTWEFYGLPFAVGEGVLIPRPDTEAVVETAIEKLGEMYRGEPLSVTDLCSGSGCIAVAVAHAMGEKVRMHAVELSGDAFPYLSVNTLNNNVDVKLFRGDVMNASLLDNFRARENEDSERDIKMDCIICNPPYLTDAEMSCLQKEVTFEPETALYGGTDGLKYYRVIACIWKEILRDGGLMIFEVGDSQAEAVSEILKSNGFDEIFTRKDGSDHTRVVGGKLKSKK